MMLTISGGAKRILIRVVFLLLPWGILVLGGCGGGDEPEYSETETTLTVSPAPIEGRETTEERTGGWSFIQAGGNAPAEKIPAKVEREFERLTDRILESQKTDPRSRASDQAISDLEEFLRRVELPANQPTPTED